MPAVGDPLPRAQIVDPKDARVGRLRAVEVDLREVPNERAPLPFARDVLPLRLRSEAEPDRCGDRRRLFAVSHWRARHRDIGIVQPGEDLFVGQRASECQRGDAHQARGPGLRGMLVHDLLPFGAAVS